ncbi:hypothetical protein BU17DRAFT_48928 [Hysterangium stoloniferum]|nr:hypothetical protein BU17DRAFT_48928 [Hysterangium stoloniferum]
MSRIPAESIELTYSFTSSKPWDTRIIPSDPTVYHTYSVKTETKEATSLFGSSHNVTEVVNESSGETIATLTWREMLPDKITFKGSAAMSIDNWMKPEFLHSHHAAFSDDQKRKYHWKNIAAGLEMELHAEDTPDTPIASFTKNLNVHQLNLTKRATEIYELCVVSFIFLEKKLSLQEASVLSRADDAGTEGFLVAAGPIPSK